MKATFRQRLLNDPFGDPCLYVRTVREKGALIFDLGDIRCLSPAELHKISDAFITHSHIDHFIGFDILLRIVLRRDVPLNIYGPASIITNVEGKLRGYTWNLIRDYPTMINVFGIGNRTMTHALFSAANGFKKMIVDKRPADRLLLDSPLFTVSAARLSHGTPCLAYRLDGKQQFNIDKDKLLKKGLTVGPWLTEFKNRIRGQDTAGTISIEGRQHRMRQLMDIVRIEKGPALSYVTDIAINPRNLRTLITFVKGSDILYSEAYFLEKDRQRALKRFHLTAAECGRIAKAADVKKLALMHFSPKYEDAPQLLIEEASKEFGGEVICGTSQQFRQSSRQRQSL